MLKVAVMGDWDSIYGFGALGMDTFRFDEMNAQTAGKQLEQLFQSGYGVVYITEWLAARIPQEIEDCRTVPGKTVILIPGISGNTGEGIRSVKKSVEQAVGSDILFGGSGSKNSTDNE
ncbi:MAG: V-type ATP synthase subunit F [Lachnospiraceae bacterium]|jgi:V/A-type H+-transporting ATPase subunit F